MISSLLSCCQLYTSPLLIIREIRSVFLASSPRFKKAEIVQLNTSSSTVNYHTIRRPRKAPKPASQNDGLDEILSQIEDLKLKLFDPVEEPYSRDSGIASSIISDEVSRKPWAPKRESPIVSLFGAHGSLLRQP